MPLIGQQRYDPPDKEVVDLVCGRRTAPTLQRPREAQTGSTPSEGLQEGYGDALQGRLLGLLAL